MALTSAERQKKWATENPEAYKAAIQRWRKNNPYRVRAMHQRFRKRHPDKALGQSRRQNARYLQMKEALAGRHKPDTCEVCGEGGVITFDHSHATGEFRAWLCDKCNRILGAAKDDPMLLETLSRYLQ